jgi:branched-chain amino acid transport system substrate-binding protein
MNWKRLLTIGLIPALLLAGALVAAQTDDLENLRIAFIGRDSGRGAELDRQLYQAALLAAEQINAGEDDDEAGIETASGDRYALEIVYYCADSAADAVDALEQAVEDDAVAVLGPHDDELAAAIEDAGTQGLPVLLGAPDSPDGESLFRLTAALEDRATTAADYLVNQRHYTRIAVLASNTDQALAGVDAFKTAAGSSVLVADIVRDADEEDFSVDVQTLRDSEAEALFVWALDDQVIALLEALREGGWDGEIVFAGLDAAFVEAAGADLTAGLVGVTNWSNAAYDSAGQTFAAAYAARWEVPAPDQAAAYYDAVALLAQAITEVGVQPASIRTELSSQTDFYGVQGEYDNATADALRVIQTRADGSFIEVVRYAGGECQNCPQTWLADTTGDSATSAETFRIGLIATLDGSAEAIGEQIEQAVRLAIREINEAGGVVGTNGVRYTLDLVTYTAESGETAGTAFEQAISDGVQIVIGPDYNAQVLPNLFRAENAGTLQLVSATLDQVTANAGSSVYQLRATDSALASAAARYLVDVRGLTRFASVAVRTDYGLDGVEAFNDVISASDDAGVLLELEHDVDADDLAALADQIVAANVEALAVWSNQPAAAALIAELDARGWQGVLVYGYLTTDFLAGLGEISFEIVAPVNWWSSAQDWLSQDFATRYTARYGDAPIPQAAAYYDAVYLIADGLDQSGESGLANWLNGLDSFVGVQGMYRPDAYGTGELSRSVLLLSVQGGVVREAARYDDVACVIGCEE